MNGNFFHHTHDPPPSFSDMSNLKFVGTLYLYINVHYTFSIVQWKLRFCLKLKPIFFTKNNTSNVILFLIALTAARIVQEIIIIRWFFTNCNCFCKKCFRQKEVKIEETTPEVRHRLTLACYEEARLPDRKCAAKHQIKADLETLFKSRRGRREKASYHPGDDAPKR